jgi:hypothetical protein
MNWSILSLIGINFWISLSFSSLCNLTTSLDTRPKPLCLIFRWSPDPCFREQKRVRVLLISGAIWWASAAAE